MGVVRVEHAGSWYFDGYNITQSVICLYCDKCGSFRISRRLTLKTIISVAVVALIAYAIRNAAEYKDRVFFGMLCFAILLQFLFMFGALELGYWCKACKNMLITIDNNVLDYPYYDKSILDIPFENTIKFIADDY